MSSCYNGMVGDERVDSILNNQLLTDEPYNPLTYTMHWGHVCYKGWKQEWVDLAMLNKVGGVNGLWMCSKVYLYVNKYL